MKSSDSPGCWRRPWTPGHSIPTQVLSGNGVHPWEPSWLKTCKCCLHECDSQLGGWQQAEQAGARAVAGLQVFYSPAAGQPMGTGNTHPRTQHTLTAQLQGIRERRGPCSRNRQDTGLAMGVILFFILWNLITNMSIILRLQIIIFPLSGLSFQTGNHKKRNPGSLFSFI